MKYLLSLIVALLIFVNPVNAFAEELILAGGCFWCLEHDLESLKGINFVQSGYSGGDLQNPTYENHEGHQEVVLVNYDSKMVTLPEILRLYFRNIDPLDGKGQFWLAEEYHQDFAEKNELKYKFYRFSCGRDQRLDKLWGDNARSTNIWSE